MQIGKDWISSGCLDSSGVPTLKCIPVVFSNLITAALYFLGAVTLLFIIYAGIKFMFSGGDPKQVQSARQTLTFAILGAILVLLSFGIVIFIRFLAGNPSCLDITNFNLLCQ